MVSPAGFEPTISPPQTKCHTEFGYREILFWSEQRDSNPQHTAWKADALPLNYARKKRKSLYQITFIKILFLTLSHPSLPWKQSSSSPSLSRLKLYHNQKLWLLESNQPSHSSGILKKIYFDISYIAWFSHSRHVTAGVFTLYKYLLWNNYIWVEIRGSNSFLKCRLHQKPHVNYSQLKQRAFKIQIISSKKFDFKILILFG